MIERTIVLPVSKDGVDLRTEVEAIKAHLAVIAGGYSAVCQVGAWLEGKRLYLDDSERVTVTVDNEQDARIVELLPTWCRKLHQICLYTHKAEVVVELVYAERTPHEVRYIRP